MWIGGDIGKNTAMNVLITYQTPHDRITLWLCWPMGDRMWFSWYDLCRCWSLCVRCFVFPRWRGGPVTMLVGTRSSSMRTEYVAVLMVVRVRARRWSRLLDWMWIGRRRHSQLTWRIDRLERCVSVEDRMKNDGSPAWSLAFIGIPRGHVLVIRYIRINLQIPRYYVFLLLYLPSALLLHFRNMHFRWRNPFRKVFLTIRKMVRNIFLPVRMTISGTWISVPLSPQVVRHAGST